jgi:gamma-glutamylcyclotransferase (GGCT)/AIG2-like uncharacterized protein YtfP
MEKVFIYGSLQEPALQRELFGRNIPVKFKAVLKDFARKNDGKYPYVIPSAGDRVEGYVILLKVSEIAIADRWEEIPESYMRRRVKVEVKPGNSMEVWVYVGKEGG